jgi:tetraacyldisaccharide 4'-kinase
MRKLLLPLSLIYWLGVIVRNWFFDRGVLKSKKVSVPVISIGNISTGGVGKTPFVELLIKRIKTDRRLAVISRGYKRKTSGTIVVSDGCGKLETVENSGDEPVQLARKYPELIVVVDEKRVRGAQKAIGLGAHLILLDDGFQHRSLDRDLNIVLLTAEEILKGDLLLPAGNRREPTSSLKRADMIVVTRCMDLQEYEKVSAIGRERHMFPEETLTAGLKTTMKAFRRLSSDEMVSVEILKNKKIIALSGIGNPKSFEDLLMKSGITILQHIVFPDHHWYDEGDMKRVSDAKRQTHADFIVTTEKDAVRLNGPFDAEPVVVAEIQQEFLSGGRMVDELLKKYE